MKREEGARERESAERGKKAYSCPAIIHSEKIEARAVLCGKADGTCTFGPADS